MYKCGHKFHKDCMIEKLKIDKNDLVDDFDEDDQDQEIGPCEVIKLPTYKERKKYVKKTIEAWTEKGDEDEDHFAKCIICRQHDMHDDEVKISESRYWERE
jgi:hypothetical protein